jgi:hypothetical protein
MFLDPGIHHSAHHIALHELVIIRDVPTIPAHEALLVTVCMTAPALRASFAGKSIAHKFSPP